MISLYEQLKPELEIKQLTNLTDKKKFVGIFKDASTKYINHEIHAVIDPNHRFKFVGGIVFHTDTKEKHGVKPEAEIVFIYVMDNYRHQQLGLKLLDIPMKRYKSLGLETNKGFTRPQAYRIYEYLGFKRLTPKNRKTGYWYWEK